MAHHFNKIPGAHILRFNTNSHIRPLYLSGGITQTKRYLGNQVRGPMETDVLRHFEYAQELFREKGITYNRFKQQCESFRIFLFYGVCGVLSLDLLLRPPKSSYWKRFSLFQLPGHIWRQLLSGGQQSVFFNNAYQGSSEGWEAYNLAVSGESSSFLSSNKK